MCVHIPHRSSDRPSRPPTRYRQLCTMMFFLPRSETFWTWTAQKMTLFCCTLWRRQKCIILCSSNSECFAARLFMQFNFISFWAVQIQKFRCAVRSINFCSSNSGCFAARQQVCFWSVSKTECLAVCPIYAVQIQSVSLCSKSINLRSSNSKCFAVSKKYHFGLFKFRMFGCKKYHFVHAVQIQNVSLCGKKYHFLHAVQIQNVSLWSKKYQVNAVQFIKFRCAAKSITLASSNSDCFAVRQNVYSSNSECFAVQQKYHFVQFKFRVFRCAARVSFWAVEALWIWTAQNETLLLLRSETWTVQNDNFCAA